MFDFLRTYAGVFGILFAFLVAAFLFERYTMRRSLRELSQAIMKRRAAAPMLFFGPANKARSELAGEINELLAENHELKRMRTGHLAQLDATLGNLQEAVLIIDADNIVLLANKALTSIFPNASHALGQRFEHIIHSAAFLEYAQDVRNGCARPQQEIAFVLPHDSRWVEVTGAAIAPAGGARGPWMLFVLHDITRQKKLEAVRKEFVANVSHELRTPLSLVKGCAETLVDGHRDMPEADREKFLLTIQRHSERLTSLIEDLLTLSRLESSNPGLQMEQISFPQFVTAIIADYRARPASSAHKLSVAAGPGVGDVRIDSRKIAQAVENLVENALKYTPPGSHIDVTAELHTSPKREIEVCVRDNGPGIPAADLPHIFERFYRVDKGRSRDTGGTGLGLSIVKHIVQLHGGRVRVESEPGRGAAFYFTLPAR